MVEKQKNAEKEYLNKIFEGYESSLSNIGRSEKLSGNFLERFKRFFGDQSKDGVEAKIGDLLMSGDDLSALVKNSLFASAFFTLPIYSGVRSDNDILKESRAILDFSDRFIENIDIGQSLYNAGINGKFDFVFKNGDFLTHDNFIDFFRKTSVANSGNRANDEMKADELFLTISRIEELLNGAIESSPRWNDDVVKYQDGLSGFKTYVEMFDNDYINAIRVFKSQVTDEDNAYRDTISAVEKKLNVRIELNNAVLLSSKFLSLNSDGQSLLSSGGVKAKDEIGIFISEIIKQMGAVPQNLTGLGDKVVITNTDYTNRASKFGGDGIVVGGEVKTVKDKYKGAYQEGVSSVIRIAPLEVGSVVHSSLAHEMFHAIDSQAASLLGLGKLNGPDLLSNLYYEDIAYELSGSRANVSTSRFKAVPEAVKMINANRALMDIAVMKDSNSNRVSAFKEKVNPYYEREVESVNKLLTDMIVEDLLDPNSKHYKHLGLYLSRDQVARKFESEVRSVVSGSFLAQHIMHSIVESSNKDVKLSAITLLPTSRDRLTRAVVEKNRFEITACVFGQGNKEFGKESAIVGVNLLSKKIRKLTRGFANAYVPGGAKAINDLDLQIAKRLDERVNNVEFISKLKGVSIAASWPDISPKNFISYFDRWAKKIKFVPFNVEGFNSRMKVLYTVNGKTGSDISLGYLTKAGEVAAREHESYRMYEILDKNFKGFNSAYSFNSIKTYQDRAKSNEAPESKDQNGGLMGKLFGSRLVVNNYDLKRDFSDLMKVGFRLNAWDITKDNAKRYDTALNDMVATVREILGSESLMKSLANVCGVKNYGFSENKKFFGDVTDMDFNKGKGDRVARLNNQSGNNQEVLEYKPKAFSSFARLSAGERTKGVVFNREGVMSDLKKRITDMENDSGTKVVKRERGNRLT